MENKKLNNLSLFEDFTEDEFDENFVDDTEIHQIDEIEEEIDEIADEEKPSGIIERIKRFGE